jgi:hypothetical protein
LVTATVAYLLVGLDQASFVVRIYHCFHLQMHPLNGLLYSSKRAKAVPNSSAIYAFKRACPFYIVVCVDLYCHFFLFNVLFSNRLQYEKPNHEKHWENKAIDNENENGLC